MLPEPVQAERIAHGRKGWTCTFKGWAMARYLRPQPGVRSVPVTFRGRLDDGKSFTADVHVPIKLLE